MNQAISIVKDMYRKLRTSEQARFFAWTFVKGLIIYIFSVVFLLGIFVVANVVLGRDSWTKELPWWLIVAGLAGIILLPGISQVDSNRELDILLQQLRNMENELLKEVNEKVEYSMARGE